jgi:hypothetical protein
MTKTEKRASPRYRIQPDSFAYYALGYGIIRDLSLASVFVEDRQQSFKVGTELDLELRLDEERIALRGTVRRSLPQQGFAVQFHKLPSETRQRLEAYFRKHFGPF